MNQKIKFEDIDKNFNIKNLPVDKNDLIFYDAADEPFELFGLLKPENSSDRFRRMPASVAESVSEGVMFLHTNTAGGRLRFRTNSKYIVLCAKMDKISRMPHIPLTGSAGFDIYNAENNSEIYIQTFIPDYDMTDGYTSYCTRPDEQMTDYTINFPLYSDVLSLSIGLTKDAQLMPCKSKYNNTKPIVYYGSSITQGGCASRAGNSYQGIISRRLNLDYINLGFSGSAKAETEMIEYINGLNMSLFVYDYDHNAPTPEYLEKTHKKMFDAIRIAHPTMPIIMVSMPTYSLSDSQEKKTVYNFEKRIEIIKKTYDSAIAAGDKNVYFINGCDMICKYSSDAWTVDGTHPNDEGFAAMAKGIGDVIEQILK